MLTIAILSLYNTYGEKVEVFNLKYIVYCIAYVHDNISL